MLSTKVYKFPDSFTLQVEVNRDFLPSPIAHGRYPFVQRQVVVLLKRLVVSTGSYLPRQNTSLPYRPRSLLTGGHWHYDHLGEGESGGWGTPVSVNVSEFVLGDPYKENWFSSKVYYQTRDRFTVRDAIHDLCFRHSICPRQQYLEYTLRCLLYSLVKTAGVILPHHWLWRPSVDEI